MPDYYNQDLMSKVAWYYYIEGMTQSDIGQKLGITRMRVIKLLAEAKNAGIIQFKIAKDKDDHLKIERDIKSTYGLQDVYVIPSCGDVSDLNESLAEAGAFYIADKLGENSYLNMGYGDTPSRLLNHLATITEKPLSIVSLTGGVNYYLPNAESNTFKAKLNLYPAPLVLSSKNAAEALLNEQSLKQITRMISLSAMSVVGIGAMNNEATILNNGILSKDDFTYLKMKGAVGDLLTHFIDKDGNPIESDLDNRLISTPLSILKNLKNVIGVAGGRKKVKIIRAALKGGYLDALITDEDTAMELLKNEEE